MAAHRLAPRSADASLRTVATRATAWERQLSEAWCNTGDFDAQASAAIVTSNPLEKASRAVVSTHTWVMTPQSTTHVTWQSESHADNLVRWNAE